MECQGDPTRVELNDILRRNFTDIFAIYFPSTNTTQIYTVSQRKQASLEALSKNATDDDSYSLRPYGTNTVQLKPTIRAKPKNGLEDPSIWDVQTFTGESPPQSPIRLKLSKSTNKKKSSPTKSKQGFVTKTSQKTSTDIIEEYLDDENSTLDVYTQYLIYRERSRTNYMCSGDEDTPGDLIKNWYYTKTSEIDQLPLGTQILILSALIAVPPSQLFDKIPTPRNVSALKREIDKTITHLEQINSKINRNHRLEDQWRAYNGNDTGIRSREDEDQDVVAVLPELDSLDDSKSK